MMTSEQYYWFVRRQQVLKAWKAQNAGNASGRQFHFFKTANPYLFACESDGMYDENALNDHFEKYAWPAAGGRCSSARWKNWHGRNYDWYFDQSPSIVLTTPKTSDHAHATLGVVKLMDFNVSDVKDGWDPRYAYLECSIVDGINDAGLVCNLNVVPPGDNPNYPTTESENEALESGVPFTKVRNVTYGTDSEKPRRFIRLICRTILDNCSTTDDVKEMLSKYSWYAARNPEEEFFEEFHAMVSDKDKTLVIEFVENMPVVHEWSAAGSYLGCSDLKYAIGQDALPVMTNFYLSKWDGNAANLGISRSISVADRNETVTEHSMGLERYDALCKCMKNPPAEWTDDDFMQKLMHEVHYRQIYSADSDAWVSEFLTRSDDPTKELRYRQDMLDSPDFLEFRRQAKALAEHEDEEDEKGIRPAKGLTWQTVHNSTYDLDKKTLTVYAQEDYENPYVFSLKQ